MNRAQLELVRDLVAAHIVNIDGSLSAIEGDPLLALVAEEGVERLEAQKRIAESVIDELDAADAAGIVTPE